MRVFESRLAADRASRTRRPRAMKGLADCSRQLGRIFAEYGAHFIENVTSAVPLLLYPSTAIDTS